MTKAGVCEKCGGTGWVIETRGGTKLANRCRCVLESRRKRDPRDVGVPERYADCTLDGLEDKNATIKAARKTARKFIEDYPAVKEGLLFIGPPGVGKTHIAVAILKEILRKTGDRCLFCDYRDLLMQIQHSYDPASEVTEVEILDPVLNCKVLLLDELASRKVTAWMHDMMFYVLNQRYSNNMITLITTNFLDSETLASRRRRGTAENGHVEKSWSTPLTYPKDSGTPISSPSKDKDEESLEERIGVRAVSRIHEMCKFVPMEGEDYRRAIIHKKHGRLD
ncbi:MAG: ATP-binding protein [Acidobacteriota bacterium]